MAKVEEALKRVPLFSHLGARQLRRLGDKHRERRFTVGTTVVREGEMSGIGFFVIESGEATVTVSGRDVATLGPGDHFGELGLIAGRERAATVTARTDLACLELTAWDFRDLVKGDPDLAWKLLQHVVTVLLDTPAE